MISEYCINISPDGDFINTANQNIGDIDGAENRSFQLQPAFDRTLSRTAITRVTGRFPRREQSMAALYRQRRFAHQTADDGAAVRLFRQLADARRTNLFTIRTASLGLGVATT